MGYDFDDIFREDDTHRNNINLNEKEINYLNEIYLNNNFKSYTALKMKNNKVKKVKSYTLPLSINTIILNPVSNIFNTSKFNNKNEISSFEDIDTSIDYNTNNDNNGLYYLSFEYSSKTNFNLKIFFNAKEDFSNVFSIEDFYPSEYFRNKIIKITDISPGDSHLFNTLKYKLINLDELIKKFDINSEYYDFVLEFEVIYFKLAKYYNIIASKNENNNSFEIKHQNTKLKIKNKWYDSHYIYGIKDSKEESLCDTCCTDLKNTIFLPCYHSCSCIKCSLNIRKEGNKCPICRQMIINTVIIQNMNKISKYYNSISSK